MLNETAHAERRAVMTDGRRLGAARRSKLFRDTRFGLGGLGVRRVPTDSITRFPTHNEALAATAA